MAGPKSAEAWRPAIEGVHAHLDIKPDKLSPYVVNVFLDVAAPVLYKSGVKVYQLNILQIVIPV